MDWSKAKTILIVALIITNSLLGYVLYVSGRTNDATLEPEFIQDTIEMLSSKDISLSTEIPNKNATLNSLYVEYQTPDPYKLNKVFFDGKGSILLKGEGLLEIINGDELISIINKKNLIYESKSNETLYNISNENEAVDLALDFLEKNNFNTEDMKLSYIRVVDGVYNIEFTKVYEGNYLESTFTNIQISNIGVKEMKRLWLNVVDTGNTPINITSAPKSILELLSMEQVYGRTITDISLCYYFDPEKHDYMDYIDNPLEARKGSAKPAWRVQFEDGYKVFLDNY